MIFISVVGMHPHKVSIGSSLMSSLTCEGPDTGSLPGEPVLRSTVPRQKTMARRPCLKTSIHVSPRFARMKSREKQERASKDKINLFALTTPWGGRGPHWGPRVLCACSAAVGWGVEVSGVPPPSSRAALSWVPPDPIILLPYARGTQVHLQQTRACLRQQGQDPGDG